MARIPGGIDLMSDPFEIIQCKSIGHHWDRVPYSFDEQVPNRFDALQLHCLSCNSDRVDWLDSRGNLMRRKYHYSNQYHAALKRTRPEWRKLLLSVQNSRRARLKAIK